jgi:hypothetical protein
MVLLLVLLSSYASSAVSRHSAHISGVVFWTRHSASVEAATVRVWHVMHLYVLFVFRNNGLVLYWFLKSDSQWECCKILVRWPVSKVVRPVRD